MQRWSLLLPLFFLLKYFHALHFVAVDEELYVKEKLAECAVVIARSDWPDEWPEMLEIIVSTASGNDATPARVELVLLFLRNLGETLRANSGTGSCPCLANGDRLKGESSVGQRVV